MDFTENNIQYIKKVCKEFVDENHMDEQIYFDEFWKIYSSALEAWIGKPPKKWRLKIPKRKFPRVIGIADGSQAIELVTPKIIEVVANSYTYISRIKEKLTLTKVEEILKKCVKKLPQSERESTVLFFAQRIFRDFQEVDGLPEEEEKKVYIIFSNTHQRGKKISRNEYLSLKAEINRVVENYLIIFDEVRGEFLIERENTKVLPSQKKALKMLIMRAGEIVFYKDLYESITGQDLNNVKELHENDRNLVHKVIYDFRYKKSNKVKSIIEVERGVGYKFSAKNATFLLIDFIH